MTIYDASVKYQAEGVPLIVIAGKSTAQVIARLGGKGPRTARVRR